MPRPSLKQFVKLIIILGVSIGFATIPHAASAIVKYNGNPIGSADYCSQANGITTIYGWAHDPQAPVGSSPYVTLRLSGRAAVTVPTNISGYRDSAINAYLGAKNIPKSSVYGWKASFTNMYKGDSFAISGTIKNVGTGTDVAMGVSTNSPIDGNASKAYFPGSKIPASCLPYRPVAPAAHAPLPTGPFKTATPTVTIDPHSDSNFTPWLQQYTIPSVKSWYPPISDYIAQSNYTPPTSVVLYVDTSYQGMAYTLGNVIHINPNWLATNMPTAQGAIIHELTHVIQNFQGYGISWVSDGIADNVRYYFYHDAEVEAPHPTNTYSDSYAVSAYFLQYINQTYNKSFIHDLNVVMNNHTYTDNFAQAKTGKTYSALWDEMMAKIVSPSHQIVNTASGKCIDVSSSNFAQGTAVQLWTCNQSSAQSWNMFNNINNGVSSLRINSNNFCLDVPYGNKTIGTAMWIWNCGGGSTAIQQQWTIRSDHSLYNPYSDRCLSSGSTITDGTKLILATCNAASPAQQWIFN